MIFIYFKIFFKMYKLINILKFIFYYNILIIKMKELKILHYIEIL